MLLFVLLLVCNVLFWEKATCNSEDANPTAGMHIEACVPGTLCSSWATWRSQISLAQQLVLLQLFSKASNSIPIVTWVLRLLVLGAMSANQSAITKLCALWLS